MQRAVLVLGLCSLLFGCLQSYGVKQPRTSEETEDLTQSNHNFARDLYGQLSWNDDNVFFSPTSIQMILALASMGSGGRTLIQMNKGLSLPSNQQTTKEGFMTLIESLTKKENIILKIANKIYTNTGFRPKAEFVQMAKKYFQSDAVSINFGNDERARQTINKWVEDNTEQKIKDLFPAGTLSPDTAMVLVNAVYFKAKWATLFNESDTAVKPFYVTATKTKDVKMMNVEGKFYHTYNDELKAQVLEIPYVGRSMSLMVVLPTEKDGLAAMEQKLSQMSLTDVLTQPPRAVVGRVNVWIPKFRMERSVNLNEVLKRMGMNSMFTSAANFSGITDTGVKVDSVAHKAFIEVNEDGSEAAAATRGSIVPLSMSYAPPPLVLFNADHPFVFMLCQTVGSGRVNGVTPGQILFMGRYVQPTGGN